MNSRIKRSLITGIGLLIAFAIWTVLIMTVDVRAIGPEGTRVGFATFNGWFHTLTGVHMRLYTVTDWLGLVPIGVCIGFGVLGLVQLIRRRSLLKVDADIILLGIYYIAVVFGYLFFEMVPINYRPVLIGGYLEASYPSSTTLLVLSVTPTLTFEIDRRVKRRSVKMTVKVLAILFAAGMALGRLIAGVHWATDIIGAVWLSFGLFTVYRAAVWASDEKKE